MLIREPNDDETLIDFGSSALRPKRPFEGSGLAVSSGKKAACLDGPAKGIHSPWRRLQAKLFVRRRRIAEIALALALVLGLGSAAYQQRRTAHALRDAIENLKVARSISSFPGSIQSEAGSLGPVGADLRPGNLTHEGTVDDRDELERRGASLLGSNNFVGALVHYQRLAGLFPNESAFRDVALVLKAKLRCTELASGPCP
jgi:hypothetical protein